MLITFQIKMHTASVFVAALFIITVRRNDRGPSIGDHDVPRQWGTGGFQILKLHICKVSQTEVDILGGKVVLSLTDTVP